MLSKIYLGVGLFLCCGLGMAYALDWKAPNLGIVDGFKSSGSGGGYHGGRSGFFYGGGFSSGK